MPWRTTAFFVRRNEIREEETTGEVQQRGTDAIQRHPFVTANCCAVGSGSQGEGLLLVWTVLMKAAQVPEALERWKFFPPGWSFVLTVLPEDAGPIYICNTWPTRACCAAGSLHLAHEETAILFALAPSFIFWHALLYSHSVSHRCPSLSSKRRCPRRSIPSADTWTLGIRMKKTPGQGSVAGLKVMIKVLGKGIAGLWESWITWWIKKEMMHVQRWSRCLSSWACRRIGENASWLFFAGLWKCPPLPCASSCSKQLQMKNNCRAGKSEPCCDNVVFWNNGVPLAWALFRSLSTQPHLLCRVRYFFWMSSGSSFSLSSHAAGVSAVVLSGHLVELLTSSMHKSSGEELIYRLWRVPLCPSRWRYAPSLFVRIDLFQLTCQVADHTISKVR